MKSFTLIDFLINVIGLMRIYNKHDMKWLGFLPDFTVHWFHATFLCLKHTSNVQCVKNNGRFMRPNNNRLMGPNNEFQEWDADWIRQPKFQIYISISCSCNSVLKKWDSSIQDGLAYTLLENWEKVINIQELRFIHPRCRSQLHGPILVNENASSLIDLNQC